MRLIDGDKLVDMLYDNEFASLCPLDEVSGVIDACPTVDAVPVVHGRWEYIPQTLDTLSQFRCSVCGWWSLDPSIDNAYNYCPNCGAKMDGGADNV